MAFEQGTPDHIPPDQPDPAMVGTSLSTLGEGTYKKSATVTPPLEQASESDQTSSDQSYFSEIPGANLGYAIKSPSSLEEVASGVRSGTELLRRLSLVSSPVQASPALDHQVAHPGLELTGRLISAAFCIPYKVEFSSKNEWELKPRSGSSALFDSFVHLASSQSTWSHLLVGWTGEIEPVMNINDSKTSLSPDIMNETSRPYPKQNTSLKTPLSKSVVGAPENHHLNSLFDGIPVCKADRERLEVQLRSTKHGSIYPVWLTAEADEPADTIFLRDQSRWRRYAERGLYPLLHYKQAMPSDGRSEKKWWLDYLRLNRLFADRIVEIYQPGDVIWVHDYHLFLLPNLLRQRIPHIYIGFYLHSPFSSSEYIRCLPKRKEILEGVLGANMIGFQTYSYSRHFSSCCTRVLGFNSTPAGVDAYGAHVAVDVFPSGIDASAVQKAAFGATDIEETAASIRKLYAGKKIIIGRDRLDSSRGVVQKLQAFEVFLERYPQWRNKVVLIQVTNSNSIEEEKEDPDNKIETLISQLVSSINGRFGSLSFSPIQYYPQYLSRQEYFALLRVADVGLITSVRDGMNTTSLEYVLCQQTNHSPLILSEFSGTAAMLPGAIHINPWDLSGVAAAIDQALAITDDAKKTQHQRLYKYVTSNTVATWSQHYLHRLLTNLSSFGQSIVTPPLDRAKLVKQYKRSKRRLFLFDYDGTLTPIVKDPQAAIPSDRVIRTIKTLAADPKNSVWIISGRDQGFLDEWMGHIPELGLSAEHGCFIRKPGHDDWESLAASTDMRWQKAVMEIFQHYTERTQGAFIERKRVALTWHYRRADPEYGSFQAQECRTILEKVVMTKWDVEVMAGKANLEVRPTFVNKGFIASRLIQEYGSGPGQPPDFVLCLGDDFTDEDMFRTLRESELPSEHVFSVTVGASSKQTLASWHLLEPADVISTIAVLSSKSSGTDY